MHDFNPFEGLEGPKFDRNESEEAESKLVSNLKPLMALVSTFGKQMELYCEDKEGKIILINMLKDMSPSKLDSGKNIIFIMKTIERSSFNLF